MPLSQPPSNGTISFRFSEFGDASDVAWDEAVKETVGEAREEGRGEVVAGEEEVRRTFAIAIDDDAGVVAEGAEQDRRGVFIAPGLFGGEGRGGFVGTFQKLSVEEKELVGGCLEGSVRVRYSVGDPVGEADELDSSASLSGSPFGKE